jgi:CPA2 family monovalent cation:H+ antiporter-2
VMVLTMDNPEVMEEVVRVVKAEWPALPVVARARDVAHAQRLIKLGANDVIPEALEGSLQLAGRVLQQLGAPESAATRRVDALRENCLDIMNS